MFSQQILRKQLPAILESVKTHGVSRSQIQKKTHNQYFSISFVHIQSQDDFDIKNLNEHQTEFIQYSSSKSYLSKKIVF